MKTPHLDQLLTTQGRSVKRLPGQIVLAYDDKLSVSYIKSGYVKRYLISKQGTLGVQALYGPGEFFPLTAAFVTLLDQNIYEGDEQYHYEAFTAAEIYVVSGKVLADAANHNPLIFKDVLIQAGIRLQSNIQQLENMSLKDPYSRIAHQLVFYANRFGKQMDDGIQFDLLIKQQDLADILSLSRETVTRVMTKLRAANLIKTNPKIVISDIDALKAVYRM